MKREVHFNGEFFELTVRGDSEPRVIGEFIDEMLGHEKWKPGTGFLMNLANFNAGPLTVADVREIAKIALSRKAEFGHARAATVVARDLEYGMLRMWGAFVEDKWDVEINIFRSRDEAIAWLKNR